MPMTLGKTARHLMMNLKRTATMIVVVGGALATWLASAATSVRHNPVITPVERSAPALDARGEALAAEIARLSDRLRPTVAPRAPARNLFQFTPERPRPRDAAPPVHAALSEAKPIAAAAPAPPFKLIGIAEDAGPSGPVRTAIVSAPGQLFLVKEGQPITLRYRVVKIGADVLELEDLSDHTSVRLVMK